MRTIETLGVTAFALTIACVAATSLLDQAARTGGLPTIAIIQPNSPAAIALNTERRAPRRPMEVDYSSTASIASRPVTLNPCNGEAK